MSAAAAAELRERSVELGEVESAVLSARAGHGSLVAVEGPAGIGKTSLLAAARELALASGLRVLSARGSELERDFAFGVVRQLFEPVLFAAGDDDRERWFSGAAALARPLLDEQPELGEAPGEEEVRFRRRHGLYWLTAGLARERAVMVAVDDAQWADEPSVGFLCHLATRLEQLPVLLLVACRPHTEGVGKLFVDPAVRVLRPAPLSGDAVAHWVTEALGRPADAEFADACLGATGGNPFLIRELLREVRAEGLEPRAAGVERLRGLSPRGVATSVLLRLSGLARPASALARSLAVLEEAEVGVAAKLAGLDFDSAVAASAALTRAGLLGTSRPLRFAHPLVRTVIYEDIPAAERALAHAEAARRLREAGADDEHVAAQLCRADPVREPWALAVLRGAAARASLRGAPEVAAHLLEGALAEADDDAVRFELLLALGRAELLAGRPHAQARLRAALELARAPEQYARAAVKLGRVLRYTAAGGEAVELLEDAAARLGDHQAPLAALIEHELLAASTVSYEARRRLADRMARWCGATEQPPRSFFARMLSAAEAVEAASRGDPAERVEELAEAALAGGAGDDHLGRHLRLLATYAFLMIDRYDRADTVLHELDEIASRRSGAELAAVVAAQRALVSSRRGRLAAAEEDAVDALEFASELDAPPAFVLTAAGALLWVAAERGEEPHPLAAGVRDDGDSMFGRHLNHAWAVLRAAQGRLREAVAEFEAVGERECGIGWTGPAQFPWRSEAALALEALGEHARARELAAEELELARALGAPRPLGIALRATALLSEPDRRLPLLEEAVAVLDGSGAELEHARALVDLGANLRRSRRPSDARAPLRRGHELASVCGATRLAEYARQELLAAGGRPRRTGPGGRDALTPSERRVVELAAKDMMNRDIAQALFITEKTVETHLGHAYSKLGLTSRRQLAKALAGEPA
jgi:DNA-binding CsgD family transcriptional regulator